MDRVAGKRRTVGTEIRFAQKKNVILVKNNAPKKFDYRWIFHSQRSQSMVKAVLPHISTSSGFELLDEAGKRVAFDGFNEPLFRGDFKITKEFDHRYDIVGLSLTIDQKGYIAWRNFVLFPKLAIIE